MNNDSQHKYRPHKKAIPVIVAVFVSAAVSGYFMGLRQVASIMNAPQPSAEFLKVDAEANRTDSGVADAVDYSQMAARIQRANADWTSHLSKLVSPPNEPPPVTPPSPEARAEARAQRARTRAFDGAPPTIPHPINQLSSASCMACHGEGAVIKDRIATKISHPHWGSCTQCHVPSRESNDSLMAVLNAGLAGNEFASAFHPGCGQRALEGAPPTIPHPVTMRNDCLSCHGPTGLPALRTTHPERQSCMQCHAPSAAQDQRILATEDLLKFLTGDGGGR